jgi:hypothetical protein
MPHPRSAGNKYECGRWLLYATLLALLGGCQRAGPDAAFEVYARGTSSPQLIVPTDALEEPPVAAAMQLDIPSGTLDALDLVSLSGCNVQATIGKRNSSLGRHAKPSQRLLLELEYLRLAPQCINLLRDRHWALANVLDVAWRQRQMQLPTLIFNATLGSDEYRSLWLNPRVPAAYPLVSHSAAVSALDRINGHVCRWLSGDYQAQNRDFEVSLSEIAGGDLLNALLTHSSGLLAADPPSKRLQSGLTPVKTLETLLASILPLQYRRWMHDRNKRVTEAFPDKSLRSPPYLPPSCGIN